MKEDFEKLPLEERAVLLLSSGSLVTCREFFAYTISLYVLEELYVELWFSHPAAEIEKIEILEDECMLDEYLKQIQLSGINEILYNPGERKKYKADMKRRRQLRQEGEFYLKHNHVKPYVLQDKSSEKKATVYDFISPVGIRYFLHLGIRYSSIVIIYFVFFYLLTLLPDRFTHFPAWF